MKIKIIDLLNKIANNEEVPKKIKIKNVIYEYRGYMYCTEKANYQDIENYLFGKRNFNILNDYAEIIEETKKIEKIARCDGVKMTHYGELYKPTENEEILRIKINELINEINNLKEND